MKLLIQALPVAPGGGLTVLEGLLAGWREAGVPLDITVLCSVRETLDALKASGHAQRVEPLFVGQSQARAFVLQRVRLARKIAAFRPDVVLATNHFVHGLRVPLVVHHQNLHRFVDRRAAGRSFSLADLLRDRLARLALHRAAANVFISGFLRTTAEQRVPSSRPRNHVIHNGVPSAWLERAASVAEGFDGSPRLVAVQSGGQHKDNPTLIRTLAELVRQAPQRPWELHVAGRPGRAGWDSVRALADELGVRDRITWHGYQSAAELEAHFRRSLCLVFTSVLEAFGLPLIEAMACRCPVVSSNCTAMPEIVGDAGRLVEPRNPQAFAEAVLSLADQPASRAALVAAGVARAQEFSWVEAARKFHQLFVQVTAS